MRRARQQWRRLVAPVLITVAAWVCALSGGPAKAETRSEPGGASQQNQVRFYKPTFVDPPKVLLGDSGDHRCPDASQPCFKDNDDLLNGRRHLLRRDDLVVAYNFFPQFFGAFVSGNLLLTSTSQITSDISGGAEGLGSATPTVTAARPFDTPYDVAVSAVFNNNNVLCTDELTPPSSCVCGLTPGPPVAAPSKLFRR